MIDKSKLKELALAAKGWKSPEACEQDRRYSEEEFAGLEFNAAANPATILELLAELESARNAALEEAAKEAEAAHEGDHWLRSFAEYIAGRIRSLATTTSTEPSDQAHVMPPFAAPAGQHDAGGVAMLSSALNHARDALRFYAEQEHFVRHQSDKWDTVSGEPQNFHEDEANTATVEDGTVARRALEDVAQAERYASFASPAPSAKQEPMPRTATREQLYTAVIDCGHSIDKDKIVLYRDAGKEGNALSQLGDRLDAIAAPSASASPADTVDDDLPPLTMSVYGTRTNLEMERQRRADIAARAAHVAAPEQEAAPPSAFLKHIKNSSAAVEGMPAWKRNMWGEQEAAQVGAKPVAWMRRWAFDGEQPAKQKKENGRIAWPFKFKLLPVTQHKLLPDDVPLAPVAQEAEQPQGEKGGAA